jgi:phosphatidylinositol phospholipase C, gamma-1
LGHNLPKREDVKDDCKAISPLIEIELISSFESERKVFRTKESKQNGLFPIWYDTSRNESEIVAVFEVSNLEYTFLRFSVIELDLVGSDILLAQASFPVTCLRPGMIYIKYKFKTNN